MASFVKQAALAVLAIGAAEQASATVLYSQNFESGTAAGFSTSGTDLWHVTSNNPASGTFALGYVENETPNSATPNGDYNGNRSGAIFTQQITLGSASTLSLDAVNYNEIGDSPDYFDRLRIGISTDGVNFAQFLASTSSQDGAVTYFAPASVGAGYTHLALDLSAYANQSVYIGFSYITEDGGDNAHPGARIDNIVVSDASAVPEPASWAMMLVGFGGIGAMLRSRRKPSVSFG